ncbi:hypothetical protein [Streptomyces sp. NPDC096132]|uniref:hypothetical protein n=1 Tax=Streptomyces sp. NPDC096132 TaxID=3366075 RepID=UPI0037F417DA
MLGIAMPATCFGICSAGSGVDVGPEGERDELRSLTRAPPFVMAGAACVFTVNGGTDI